MPSAPRPQLRPDGPRRFTCAAVHHTASFGHGLLRRAGVGGGTTQAESRKGAQGLSAPAPPTAASDTRLGFDIRRTTPTRDACISGRPRRQRAPTRHLAGEVAVGWSRAHRGCVSAVTVDGHQLYAPQGDPVGVALVGPGEPFPWSPRAGRSRVPRPTCYRLRSSVHTAVVIGGGGHRDTGQGRVDCYPARHPNS